MRAVSKQAAGTLRKIADMADAAGGHVRIDNTGGAFMPVLVERVRECAYGVIYSVAHYYEQNGDLMRHPDMEFIATPAGQFYPISFWQDGNPTVRQEAIHEWTADGKFTHCNARMQSDEACFANVWMRNIEAQQFARPGPHCRKAVGA